MPIDMTNPVRLIEGSTQLAHRCRKVAAMADLNIKEYGSIQSLIESIRSHSLRAGVPEPIVDAHVGRIIDARRRLVADLETLANAAAGAAAMSAVIATETAEIQARRRAALRGVSGAWAVS